MTEPHPESESAPRHRGDIAPVSLSFDGVGKQFGDRWVLRDLDLEVPQGTILGLIGPSGCGKTTTLRLATGIHRADEGEVRLLGERPHDLPARLRRRIGYLPQDAVLFGELSLAENLVFHASLNGVRLRSRRQRRRLLELVELWDDRRTTVDRASGGMKRRLALAAALIHDPAFIILDEPTAGIDPVLRRTFWEHFRALRDEGRTFVVTTQYVGEAADCDVVILLSDGRIVAQGPPEELRRLAAGGDELQIRTDAAPMGETLAELRSWPEVKTLRSVEPTLLRILVDDGGPALHRIVTHLEDRGVTVIDSEELIMGYHEVFIRLVEDTGGRTPAVAAR